MSHRFTKLLAKMLATATIAASSLGLTGCGYNDMVGKDEGADLIPNIVNTVKGEANFEQETLTKVIEARSKATSIQATPELANNPEALAKFSKAQGEVSSALSRLLVVTENYPNLKANQGFQDLRAQLEGTENRIGIARKRYIDAVKDYNVSVRSFPQNLVAMVTGFKEKPSLTVENEAAIKVAPTVDFNKKP
jgi:LemA protein